MKIISNKRYKKLEKLEIWEKVKMDRGYQKFPPSMDILEEYIKWFLCDNLDCFLSVEEYGSHIKKKKGEIGKLFGMSIIIK